MRHPALQGRRDANEPAIIAALERVGATVDKNPIGKGRPDLDVGYQGVNYKLEVKVPGKRLNKKQIAWHSKWAGQVAVVSTPEGALDAIGYQESPDDICRRHQQA